MCFINANKGNAAPNTVIAGAWRTGDGRPCEYLGNSVIDYDAKFRI